MLKPHRERGEKQGKGCWPECGGFCCTCFTVFLNEKELDGRYKMVRMCPKDHSLLLRESARKDPHKRFRLKKKTNGHCVYFDEKAGCTINDEKPFACYQHACGESKLQEWKLTIAAKKENGKDHKETYEPVPEWANEEIKTVEELEGEKKCLIERCLR